MPDGTLPAPIAPAATRAARPLAILYVMAAFPVLSETFVTNEIRAMRARGHRIVPLALAPFDGACQPEDAAFRAETLALAAQPRLAAALHALTDPAGLAKALAFARAQRGIGLPWLMLGGAQVARAARRAGAGHIHAHFAHVPAAIAIVAARLAGLTCSFTAHGYDVYGAPADLPAKLAAADVAIATCEDMRADFLAMAPRARVRIVPCGVDPARFLRPPSVAARNGRLLAIGRLCEQKGYPVLIAALARLPVAQRPTVDAIGGGPLEAELKALAAAAGVADHLRFLGPQTSGWIAAQGPAYGGFVAPYVICGNGDRDTGPVAVKEAMGMELPVLASAIMGNKDMVTPGTGRLIAPDDPAALAEGLAWLAGLAEPERCRLGAAGRQRLLEHYTLAQSATLLEAAFAGAGRA